PWPASCPCMNSRRMTTASATAVRGLIGSGTTTTLTARTRYDAASSSTPAMIRERRGTVAIDRSDGHHRQFLSLVVTVYRVPRKRLSRAHPDGLDFQPPHAAICVIFSTCDLSVC